LILDFTLAQNRYRNINPAKVKLAAFKNYSINSKLLEDCVSISSCLVMVFILNINRTKSFKVYVGGLSMELLICKVT